MKCAHIVSNHCAAGHERSWKCHAGPPTGCIKCEQAAKRAEEKRQKKYALQQKRDAEQLAHTKAMTKLDEDIEQQAQAMQDERLKTERQAILRQKEADLASMVDLSTSPHIVIPPPQISAVLNTGSSRTNLKTTPDANSSQPQYSAGSKVMTPTPAVELSRPAPSDSEIEWARQKSTLSESNETLDSIMSMIGLEQVKEQVLVIKAGIEAKKRQNASFKQERFSTVLLGNPGTGKTVESSQIFKLTHSPLFRENYSRQTLCQVFGLLRCSPWEYVC